MPEKLTRTSYVTQNGVPREAETGNIESRVDMEQYIQPLARMHSADVHDWGVASGLGVTATVGASGIRVLPGVAVDAAGRTISLAAGTRAKLADQTLTPVTADGIAVQTASAAGSQLVTIAWAETFDRATFTSTGAFRIDDTPLVRLRSAGNFTDDGGELVLAQVDLDEAGKVTGLSRTLRRGTGISVEKVRFGTSSTSAAGSEQTVQSRQTSELRGEPDGGVSVSTSLLVPDDGLRIGHGQAPADTFQLRADAVGGVRGLRVYSGVGPADRHIFTVLSNGRVGIGTTNPAGALDLPGEIAIVGKTAITAEADRLILNRDTAFARGVSTPGSLGSASLNVGGVSSGGDPGQGNVSVRGWLRLGDAFEPVGTGSAGKARFVIADPTPNDTWNTAAFHKAALGPNWSHIHWGPTGDWFIRSASSAGKVILQDTGGRVGVGTSGPATTLDVNGSVGITGKTALSTHDGYLRLNQLGAFSRGVHTPGTMSSRSMNVGGAFSWGDPGSGNLVVTGKTGLGTERITSRLSVKGDSSTAAIFADGSGAVGILAVGNPNAAAFWGDVSVVGKLTKSSGTFKIDHPLDPERKYLSHSFVESDEMKNVYDGEVELDERGEASVEVADWFEALNERFRYQLTPIGAPAPGLHIARELSGNRFAIAGGEPGTKVCWQVTGVRHDPYAVDNPILVEEDKPEDEIGTFLHPVSHGEPAERGLDFSQLQDARDDAGG